LSAGNRYHPGVRWVNDVERGQRKGSRVMDADETIIVETRTVACDGGGGPLGHPAVYLKIGDEGEIVCPYCSRHYVLAEGAPAAAGH